MPRARNTPAQTAGAQRPAKPIAVEWSETAHYRASLAPDEIRALLGLGGTPDDTLRSRVAMIGQYAPTALAVLIDHSEYTGSTAYSLELVDGLTPGDL